ncbi:MAG: C39 family peptidase [Clostridia bacterium]|nr:C39 family peptidase [Clostridia bacterium]
MKKRICCILLFISVLLSCSGCFENKDSTTKLKNVDEKAFENIVLDKDLAEISELNGIVKIDSILSGLDTFSFDTVIFDLEKSKELCSISFPEGAWISGLTEKGFYAVDTSKKELLLYDRNGKITRDEDLSSITEPINFCALSENEMYFLYSNSAGTQITVINLSNNQKSYIELESPLRDTLSFKDNILRAVSIDQQVFELDVTKLSCTIVLVDQRIKLFSSNYCLGETETNFLLTNQDECLYVPISSADEVVLEVLENGFVTTTVSGNKNLLRFYDLKKKTVSYFYTTEPVEGLCCIDNQRILAVTGYPMEKKHKIIICKPTSSEEITVLSQDATVNTEAEHSSSQEVTSTPNKIIDNVPVIAQFPKYPTGCEAVSAVMALNYFGNEISVERFVDEFLPTSRNFYIENGKNFGPSPYEYFIGNPKSSASYGCMAPVIEKALCECLGDSQFVKKVTGITIEEICEQYINNNIPVIFWATIHMLETNPQNSWHLSDGTRFTWPGNEHCMLLVGYDSKQYYFNDPYAGKLVAYEKALTEDRFAEMGRQAIVILPQ